MQQQTVTPLREWLDHRVELWNQFDAAKNTSDQLRALDKLTQDRLRFEAETRRLNE